MDIDRIARQIVDAEPSADLEARIRARLDAEPAASRRRVWPQWAMAGGVMAGAVAVVVAISLAGDPTPVEVPVEVMVSRSPEVVTGVGVQLPQGGEVVTPVEVREPREPEVKTAALSEDELAWMDRRIPALEPVEELRVDLLAYESIQPEELSITPLIMTALPTDGTEFERRDNR